MDKLVNLFKLNSGVYLCKTRDFLKKYPEYGQELAQDFSHVLFIPENLAIQDFIFLQDILREHEILKLFIIIEKNSCVKIHNKILKFFAKPIDPSINSGRTGGGECFSSEISVLLKESASLTFFHEDFFQQSRKNSYKFSLQQSSKLDCFVCLAGEQDIEFLLDVLMVGQNAQANVKGFYAANKIQKINLQTEQRHLEKNTSSSLEINGVLADGSQIKYCGKIFVAKDAKHVKATQENKNIILGENATNISVEASPELQVLNEQAECKHGCAIGEFDKNQLFYLQSRGLTKQQATQVLIEGLFGFVNNLFANNLDYDIKIRESLIEQIKVKLREMT